MGGEGGGKNHAAVPEAWLLIKFLWTVNMMRSKIIRLQGGHAQVKVKFPAFSLCLQFFPCVF